MTEGYWSVPSRRRYTVKAGERLYPKQFTGNDAGLSSRLKTTGGRKEQAEGWSYCLLRREKADLGIKIVTSWFLKITYDCCLCFGLKWFLDNGVEVPSV